MVWDSSGYQEAACVDEHRSLCQCDETPTGNLTRGRRSFCHKKVSVVLHTPFLIAYPACPPFGFNYVQYGSTTRHYYKTEDGYCKTSPSSIISLLN